MDLGDQDLQQLDPHVPVPVEALEGSLLGLLLLVNVANNEDLRASGVRRHRGDPQQLDGLLGRLVRAELLLAVPNVQRKLLPPRGPLDAHVDRELLAQRAEALQGPAAALGQERDLRELLARGRGGALLLRPRALLLLADLRKLLLQHPLGLRAGIESGEQGLLLLAGPLGGKGERDPWVQDVLVFLLHDEGLLDDPVGSWDPVFVLEDLLHDVHLQLCQDLVRGAQELEDQVLGALLDEDAQSLLEEPGAAWVRGDDMVAGLHPHVHRLLRGGGEAHPVHEDHHFEVVEWVRAHHAQEALDAGAVAHPALAALHDAADRGDGEQWAHDHAAEAERLSHHGPHHEADHC
mmetsp:Transcript_116461/g.324554  ORF Transcript_116461/g.324554 Transcript_116461/m.324554 type:complete len:349 (-) Transcript_116461:66-1112(-)